MNTYEMKYEYIVEKWERACVDIKLQQLSEKHISNWVQHGYKSIRASVVGGLFILLGKLKLVSCCDTLTEGFDTFKTSF